MKITKMLSALLAAILIVLSSAGCSLNNNDVETTDASGVQQSESGADEAQTANNKNDENNPQNDGDNLLITLYANRKSDAYNSVSGDIQTIETGVTSDTDAGYFRFISPKDGVTVRLEEIVWSSLTTAFEPVRTVFEITALKNTPYEFECYVAASIPSYRIVAQCGDERAEYSLSADGEEEITHLEMRGVEFLPDEITGDSAFYQLCVARAASKVFYEGYAGQTDPAVVWNTVAYAVTRNDGSVGDGNDDAIGMSKWELESYMNSMYPEYKGSYPEFPEECTVQGSMSQYSDYDVTPTLFESFCTDEFYGVEDNGDGTLSVLIRIDDYRFEGCEELGFAVIVRPCADNPFGFAITDIVDYDLPVG